MQDSLQLEEIEIKGPFTLIQIEELSISEKVNEHGKMVISGIINEKTAKEWMKHSLKDSALSVCDKRQKRPLFTGLIEKAILTEIGHFYRVIINCTSYTILLDRKEENCSFQDITMRYIDVIQATGKFGGVNGRIIVTAEQAKSAIGKPLFQYRETSWDFIRRIAGKLQAIVIPEVTYGIPQLCLGCVKGESYEAEDVQDYQVFLDLNRLRLKQGAKGKWQFISYHIKCGYNYELGDKILFKGKELIVMQKELKMERGSLEGSYVLGYEAGFCLPVNPNKKIKGVSLEGTVIDIKEGMVKVHLDIDPQQEKERAHWFRYAPVSGDIMYSVPECGARILLTFIDEDENVLISDCIRRNSELLPEPEIKMMWVNDKKYIAAPEYMGFLSEQLNSIESVFLDDEWGVVIHTGNRLQINARDGVLFHAKGKVIFNSTVRTVLKHPKGKGEQAWIEMDCGNMTLGGKKIEQSGGEMNGISATNQTESLSEKEIAEIAMSMLPVSLSDTAEDLDSYIVMAGTNTDIGDTGGKADNIEKEKEGGVTSGGESIDSENDGEKKALIYVNGKEFSGYVYGENTYVDNYDEFVSHAFGADTLSQPDRRYNIESMVNEMGMENVFSSWEQSEDLRIIICNTDAKRAHLKVNRIGTELIIHLYPKMLYIDQNAGGGFYFAPLDKKTLLKDGSTVPEALKKGVKLWEGPYHNKISKDTGVVYDDFGADGLVNVKVKFYFESDYRIENNIPTYITLDEGEGNDDYQRFYLAALVNNQRESFKGHVKSGVIKICGGEENRSSCQSYSDYYYRRSAVMLAYRYYRGKFLFFEYTGNKDESSFLHMLAHETGHIFGLGDAYDRSWESGKNPKEKEMLKAMKGAKITDEIPKNDLMINNKTITSNDVEMVLEAWRSAKQQNFYEAKTAGFIKSSVIRQDKKDKKKWF